MAIGTGGADKLNERDVLMEICKAARAQNVARNSLRYWCGGTYTSYTGYGPRDILRELGKAS